MELKIKGHSGCDVNIFYENGVLLVRKSTNDPQYFGRLLAQINKQKEAATINFENFKVPKICTTNITEGCVSFSMPYVHSKSFVEYFEQAGFDDILFFIRVVKNFVQREIENSELTRIDRSVFVEKYLDVRDRIKKNISVSGNPDLIDILRKTDISLLNVEDFYLPVGCCHGDFTFSNILFTGREYYLIDFLDSFIESPLVDMVKIRQDSFFFWSKLMCEDDVDDIHLEIVREKIDEELDSFFANYDWYIKYYNDFQVLNLLRVLQYAKEEKIVDFLLMGLNRIIG